MFRFFFYIENYYVAWTSLKLTTPLPQHLKSYDLMYVPPQLAPTQVLEISGYMYLEISALNPCGYYNL